MNRNSKETSDWQTHSWPSITYLAAGAEPLKVWGILPKSSKQACDWASKVWSTTTELALQSAGGLTKLPPTMPWAALWNSPGYSGSRGLWSSYWLTLKPKAAPGRRRNVTPTSAEARRPCCLLHSRGLIPSLLIFLRCNSYNKINNFILMFI